MHRPPYATAQAAEAAFYDAFERADIDAMMAVWADDQGIICIHPMGPALRGRAAVRRSWQAIFRNSPAMRLRISDGHYFQDTAIAVHVVQEDITVDGDDKQHASILAANAYRLTTAGWRLFLHHASPAPKGQEPRRGAPQVLH